MRYRHYQLATLGQQEQAVREAQELVQNAERQVWTVLNDIDGAIKYIVDGEKQHPNRHDVLKGRGGAAAPLQSQVGDNKFFTSAPGQFPSFGTQPSVSAPPHPTPASLVRPTTSYGQPSAHASSFGQPSSLGPPKSSFGQPTSAFAQFSNPTPLGGKGFAQAASSSSAAFSQAPKASQFGQVQNGFPVTSGTPSEPQPPPVSALAQANNPFGQNIPPASLNPFSQQAPFGIPPSGSGAFGKSTVQQQTNVFSQPAKAKPNPFAPAAAKQKTVQSGAAANSSRQAGNTGQFSRSNVNETSIPADAKRDPQGKLMTWKGKPVQHIDNEPCYRDTDGSWKRIWFPDGPPVFTKAVELPNDVYDEKTKENYRYLREHGTFKEGPLPELPPRREWCSWNF